MKVPLHTLAGAVAVILATLAVAAQDRRPATPQQAAEPERRMALIVGNDAYADKPLVNAGNDARAMAAALRELGFTVSLAANTRLAQLDRAVDQFVNTLRPGDVALFFYAGHGIQIDGENYLVPIGFDARDATEAKYEGYSASRVHDRISAVGVRLTVMVLDACRDNPYVTTRSGAGGLAAMGTGRGSLIALATAPGQTASDNAASGNGLFTGALLATLREPGLGLDAVFSRVRQSVAAASGNRQVPWTTSSVIGDFVFRPATVVIAPPPAVPASTVDAAIRAETAFWESIKDSRDVTLFDAYLAQYPAGIFRVLADARRRELRAGATSAPAMPPASSSTPAISSRVAAPPPSPSHLDRWTCALPECGEMVYLRGGTFQMGSPASEAGRDDDEAQHAVAVAGFWMDVTEVTVGAFAAFARATGKSPPTGGQLTLPVERVSWHDARSYCGWVGKRLPMEAEWEYAARAGTTTAYWWGNAWDGTKANALPRALPVGEIAHQNPWGLSDMVGNVREWTSSLYRGYPYRADDGREDPKGSGSRAVRGGAWVFIPQYLRVAFRYNSDPQHSNNFVGFRCAQSGS